MGRLIDADEAIKEINQIELNHPYDDKEDILEKAISIVVHAPTVDAVPVVHGRWVFNPRIGEHECSNCKGSISLSDDTASHPRYCPQCGAKMDKGE